MIMKFSISTIRWVVSAAAALGGLVVVAGFMVPAAQGAPLGSTAGKLATPGTFAKSALVNNKALKPPKVLFNKTFTFSKDLSARDILWISDNKARPNDYMLSFVVDSQGEAFVEPFAMRVTVRGVKKTASAVTIDEDSGLDPGESETYTIYFNKKSLAAAVGAIKTVQVTIDPANQITESNEQNNTMELNIGTNEKPPTDLMSPSSQEAAAANLLAKKGLADLFGNAKLKEDAKQAESTPPAETKPAPPKQPTLKEPANDSSVTVVTPVLNWTDNGPGKNYFRWYVLNPDSNQRVWERDWERGETVDKLCTNALNQWICQYATVPAGKLNFDQSYKWTVKASDGKASSGYASSSQFNIKYEYVPIQFKSGTSGGGSQTTSCSGHQTWNGTACACPGGLFEAPAPYCCPFNQYWSGTQCQIIG